MKYFTLVMLTCWISSHAQLTLEHQYENNWVTRVNLGISGEKYYLYNRSNSNLEVYNDDHTLWKSILLEIPFWGSSPNPTTVFHVSDNIFNSDPDIEIVYGYYDFASAKHMSKVISEDGTLLLLLEDTYNVRFSHIQGYPDKLIASPAANDSGNIYSVPELEFENTYDHGAVRRLELEISGPKYFVFARSTHFAEFHNEDHSLWKVVSLPIPDDATYRSVDVVSETKIAVDPKLEVGYTYYVIPGSVYQNDGLIVNEDGDVLLTLPGAVSLTLSSFAGVPDKLIANRSWDTPQTPNTTDIYGLPALTLDHSFGQLVTRTPLEISGEKYYGMSPNNVLCYIYNADYTLWKTVTMPPENFYTLSGVYHISESKVNADPLVELFERGYYSPEGGGTGRTRVINENGDILNFFPGVYSLTYSDIPGLAPKFIGSWINTSGVTETHRGSVYSAEMLALGSFVQNRVLIAPNPAADLLRVYGAEAVESIHIIDTNGRILRSFSPIADGPITLDISDLASGMYVLDVRSQGTKSAIRFVKD
jgi:hypothetical protein